MSALGLNPGQHSESSEVYLQVGVAVGSNYTLWTPGAAAAALVHGPDPAGWTQNLYNQDSCGVRNSCTSMRAGAWLAPLVPKIIRNLSQATTAPPHLRCYERPLVEGWGV